VKKDLMKCSTPTPFRSLVDFSSTFGVACWGRLVAQVYSHEVNNSKPRLFYGEDGSVISFLATLKFFNSSQAFSALSRSLVGLVSILSEAHNDIC